MSPEVVKILCTRWRVKIGDENATPKLEILVKLEKSGNSWILLDDFPCQPTSLGKFEKGKIAKIFKKYISKTNLSNINRIMM